MCVRFHGRDNQNLPPTPPVSPWRGFFEVQDNGRETLDARTLSGKRRSLLIFGPPSERPLMHEVVRGLERSPARAIGLANAADRLSNDYRSQVSSKVLNCPPTGVVSLAL